MKQQKILNYFVCFLFLLALLPDVEAQFCGTTRKSPKKISTTEALDKMREINALKPDSYHFMVKHHIFRTPDGSQPIQQSEIEQVMIELNRHFDNTNIQFHDCGNPEIIRVANKATGIIIVEGNNANDFKTEEDHDMKNTINIYWPFDLYDYYDPNDIGGGNKPIGGVKPGGSGRSLYINNPFVNLTGNITSVTLAHELGHYFELDHTFGDYQIGQGPASDGKGTTELVTRAEGKRNCETEGDGFCDTPADPNRFGSSCSISSSWKDENEDLYIPDAKNFMSYARNSCQFRFSYEQSVYMLYTARQYNHELTQYKKEITVALHNTAKTYIAPAIVANNTITGSSDVKYKAQSEVKLDPGFKAAKGTKFNAWIAYDCNNLGLPNSSLMSAQEITGIKEDANEQAGLTVYPNPFSSQLQVSFSLTEDGFTTLSIQNLYGQEVLKINEEIRKKGSYSKQFDLTELAGGIYFLVLKSNSTVQTKKLLKTE